MTTQGFVAGRAGVVPGLHSDARGGVRRSRRWSPGAARGVALLVVLGAAVAGFVATDPALAARAVAHDPELAWVLRSMAVLKMAMAAAATACVAWRLGSAASAPWLAGYALAGAAMWMGPGLIWNMAAVRTGALLLHGGLAGVVVLLWRDPVVGARLAAIIAERRRVVLERWRAE